MQRFRPTLIHDHTSQVSAPVREGGGSGGDESAMSDHTLAVDLAHRAGALLLEVRAELVAAGADERTIKDAGDLRSHDWLMERLATLRPNDAVLSEEGKDDQARLSFARAWIIDPLDGTREFSEIRDDWAVHVAHSAVPGHSPGGSAGRVGFGARHIGRSHPLDHAGAAGHAPNIGAIAAEGSEQPSVVG